MDTTLFHVNHYSDVILSAMAPQITSLQIVYSMVYSGADSRKHQSSVLKRKMFPFDDVIMTPPSFDSIQFKVIYFNCYTPELHRFKGLKPYWAYSPHHFNIHIHNDLMIGKSKQAKYICYRVQCMIWSMKSCRIRFKVNCIHMYVYVCMCVCVCIFDKYKVKLQYQLPKIRNGRTVLGNLRNRVLNNSIE